MNNTECDIDCEKHIENMRNWFYENFEHPYDAVPYDSEEKTFIYIWGGPCYARDELETKFSGDVPEECIQLLVDELEQESLEWSPTPTFEQLQGSAASFDDCIQALINIRRLLDVNLAADLSDHMNRMLFANVITVLETYLADTFIKHLDNEYMRSFVKTNPAFQSEKFTLSKVFSVFDGIEKRIINCLNEIIWHNIDKVKLMYKSTFDIDFPDNTVAVICKAVTKRHDIVHRNGKNTDWKEISISKKEVQELIVTVEELASYIDRNLPVK